MTNTDKLLVNIEDQVATITLNRPDARNAMDVDILEQLPEILKAQSTDPEVRCVVVRGSGDKAFSAGGDISNFSGEGRGSGARLGTDLAPVLEQWSQASVLLREMPKPTLAVINGVAAGAGMSLALSCDFRLGCERSRFVTSFARLAMSGDFGGSFLLTQIVGTAKARELYFFSEAVEAQEAKDLGLLNWLVDSGQLEEKLHKLCEHLTALPPITSRNMKANLNESLNWDIAQAVAIEAERMTETSMNPETAAAARAFFNKSK